MVLSQTYPLYHYIGTLKSHLTQHSYNNDYYDGSILKFNNNILPVEKGILFFTATPTQSLTHYSLIMVFTATITV